LKLVLSTSTGRCTELFRTMFALAAVLLYALSFASLAYVASRKGHHTMAAALAAAGAWLFGVTSVLIWIWR
jgi:hypothetical protein